MKNAENTPKTAIFEEGKLSHFRHCLRCHRAALALLAQRLFIPAEDRGVWLVFARPSGRSLGLISGWLKPRSDAEQTMRTVGVGEVNRTLYPIVAECGVHALRWNGKAVVASGQ